MISKCPFCSVDLYKKNVFWKKERQIKYSCSRYICTFCCWMVNDEMSYLTYSMNKIDFITDKFYNYTRVGDLYSKIPKFFNINQFLAPNNFDKEHLILFAKRILDLEIYS